MRKRDDAKNRRETLHALAMILQIGLAVMVCMGMSLAMGIYFAADLTGHYRPGSTAEKAEGLEKGQEDEHSKDNPD